MKPIKKILILITLICSSSLGAQDFLSIQCLKNYKILLKPVNDVLLRDGIETSKISLPNLLEYHDLLPQTCSSELGFGELKIVELNNKLFIFNLVLYTSNPIFLKSFSAPKQAMIEVGLKYHKQGAQDIKTSISDQPFQYKISKSNEKKYIESLNFENIETAHYE